MGRPKLDTVNVGFRMLRATAEMLKVDAERNGVSVGSYVAMLVSQKRIETQAMTFVSNIPPEKLREMLAKDDK